MHCIRVMDIPNEILHNYLLLDMDRGE